jgi:hypothetical protein
MYVKLEGKFRDAEILPMFEISRNSAKFRTNPNFTVAKFH